MSLGDSGSTLVLGFAFSTLVLRKKKSSANVTAPKLPLSNYLAIGI